MSMLFKIPIIVAGLQSIPEGFLIVIVGLKLFNIDIKLKEAIGISVVYGILSYLIREYVAVYGLHTIFSIIILIVLVKMIEEIPFFHSTVSVLLSFLLTGIFQAITVPMVLQIMNMSFEKLSENPKLTIVAAIPTFALLGIIYLILNGTGFYLYNLKVFKKE